MSFLQRFWIPALALLVACTPGALNFTGERDLGQQVNPEISASSGRIRLANRIAIATALNDIFGPTAEPITSLLIFGEGRYFGGPCDKYFGDCRDPAESQLAMVPVATSPRAALLTRACDLIVSDDTAVLNAVAHVRDNSQPLPQPTGAELEMLFDVFNPGRSPSAEVSASLMGLVEAVAARGDDSIEAWRFVLLALCMSPSWQVP